MKPKAYIIIALLTLLSGCTKDDSPKLPPATQIGANTFGCKVNGITHKCYGYYNSRAVISFGGVYCYFRKDNRVAIGSKCGRLEDSYIVAFNFKFEGKPGVYRDIKYAKKGSDSYVKVTKYNHGVISGIFHIVQEYPTGDIFHFTEGRFDIKLKN